MRGNTPQRSQCGNKHIEQRIGFGVSLIKKRLRLATHRVSPLISHLWEKKAFSFFTSALYPGKLWLPFRSVGFPLKRNPTSSVTCSRVVDNKSVESENDVSYVFIDDENNRIIGFCAICCTWISVTDIDSKCIANEKRRPETGAFCCVIRAVQFSR